MATVTFPTEATYIEAFILISSLKLLSDAKFIATTPSFNNDVSTLYLGLGTPFHKLEMEY